MILEGLFMRKWNIGKLNCSQLASECRRHNVPMVKVSMAAGEVGVGEWSIASIRSCGFRRGANPFQFFLFLSVCFFVDRARRDFRGGIHHVVAASFCFSPPFSFLLSSSSFLIWFRSLLNISFEAPLTEVLTGEMNRVDFARIPSILFDTVKHSLRLIGVQPQMSMKIHISPWLQIGERERERSIRTNEFCFIRRAMNVPLLRVFYIPFASLFYFKIFVSAFSPTNPSLFLTFVTEEQEQKFG